MAGRAAAVPKGLDTLTAEDTAAIDAMRNDQTFEVADAPGADAATAAPAPTPSSAPDSGAVAAPVPDNDDDDAPPAAGDSRTVPHAAFHAERERRKAAEKEAREAAQRQSEQAARFEERINALVAAAQVSTAVAPPPVAPEVEEPLPDVNTDPVGHFQKRAERDARTREAQDQKIQALEGIINGMQAQQQRQAQAADLRNWGMAQEMAFEAANPDYRAAMEFLQNARRQELEFLGIRDPQQQANVFGQDIQAIATQSRQQGANFAERLYGLAKQRGYQKADATPAATNVGIPPLGAATGPTIAIPPADAAARAARGRENAATIGSAGSAPAPRMTAAQIADMSDAQFTALMKRMEGDPTALRDLMGH